MICYVPLVHDLAPTVKIGPTCCSTCSQGHIPSVAVLNLSEIPDATLSPLVEQASLAGAVFVAVAEGHLTDVTTNLAEADSVAGGNGFVPTRRHAISVQKDSYVQALRSATADTAGLGSGDVRNGSC